MGRRHTGRKLAMQILYQIEVRSVDIETVLEDYKYDKRFHKETLNWAFELANGAWSNCQKSDDWIKKYAIDWEFSRINPLDKSLLRMAFYELCCTDTPHTVILNEAIELAKKYSSDDSPKFINGILGSYVKDVIHA